MADIVATIEAVFFVVAVVVAGGMTIAYRIRWGEWPWRYRR